MPSEPSEHEKQSYYYGLHGRPLLVARSSTNEWMPHFEDQHQVRKAVYPVGEHPIVEVWAVGLSKRLYESFSDVAWVTIDLVRIGFVGASCGNCPVLIWISVEPGSTDWRAGRKCVQNCMEILKTHSLHDVQCEVREGRLTRQVGPPLLPPNGDADLLPFTSTIGQAISTERLTREGTLSILLEDCDRSEKFGLTCRHVLLDDDNTTDFKWREGDAKIEVMQPGTTTWSQKHASWKDIVELTSYERYKELRERAARILHVIESFQEEKDRVIGFVTFAPAVELYQSTWLQDFAIFKLDDAKFQNSECNLVRIDDIAKADKKIDTGDTEFKKFVQNLSFMGDLSPSVLELQRMVPLNEILALREPRRSTEWLCKIVSKRGRSTDLTFGYLNNVESVVRWGGKISEELCITSVEHSRFSSRGDSGAAVFDVQGNVYGMLTSGLDGQVAKTDVTYVTPLERILDSIGQQTNQKLRLLVRDGM